METLSEYDLEIVYCTGEANTADGLSHWTDYKVAAKAEDSEKQANKAHKEVLRINAA